MNYDDLLWKCQGILSSQDYMRLAGLIAAERELRAQQTQTRGCQVCGMGKDPHTTIGYVCYNPNCPSKVTVSCTTKNL